MLFLISETALGMHDILRAGRSFGNPWSRRCEPIIRRQAGDVNSSQPRPPEIHDQEFEMSSRMRTKWTAAIALLAVMIWGGSALSYAQGAEGLGHGWGHEHGFMGHMFHDLNLTDAQKQQVKTIMEANKATMHSLMLQMTQNRLAMLQATSNGTYNQAAIQSLANQQAQLQAQMMIQHQALQHQVYTQVLTAEQQTKFNEKQAEQISHVTERLQEMQSQAATPGGPQ